MRNLLTEKYRNIVFSYILWRICAFYVGVRNSNHLFREPVSGERLFLCVLICFSFPFIFSHVFFVSFIIHSGPEISWQTPSKLLQSKPGKLVSVWCPRGAVSSCFMCVVPRDSAVVQGNSILALSGLAAVLAKYESNLPSDGDGGLGVRPPDPSNNITVKIAESNLSIWTEIRTCRKLFKRAFVTQAGPEFVPTASWLAMVLDTLLSIISSSYKARGQVFPWFLHVSFPSVRCFRSCTGNRV